MSQYTFVFDDYEFTSANELLFRYSYMRSEYSEGPGSSQRAPNGAQQANAIIGRFEERYVLPLSIDTTDDNVRYILQQLHVIIGVSYYKSLLGEVSVPYQLTADEADYYNTIYDNGLAEYAYINKVSEQIKPFKAIADGEHERSPASLQLQGALLGIGGGKDSSVSAEIAKAISLPTTVIGIATGNHHGQAGAVMDITGLPQLRIERYFDTSLVNFSEKNGGKNGHIPFSAILAWLGVLIAYSNSNKYVMMANEAASSIGSTIWNGKPVNHQWSKSYEFEKLTQAFIHAHLSPDLWYFSPIRPYGSLAIMELFAKLGQPYYDDFTSCNLVLRIDPSSRPNGRWCTRCAKCLSTWLLLSPWIETAKLEQIFGRNLFDDVSLRPLLESLLGLSGHKPLDCVGTVEELRAVTRETLELNLNLPLLQDIALADIPGPHIKTLINLRSESGLPSQMALRIESVISGLIVS